MFPVNADDGLVKSNMEKLTFYSVSSPEKLDRIGEYLYQKASKDINRKRYKYGRRTRQPPFSRQQVFMTYSDSLSLVVTITSQAG